MILHNAFKTKSFIVCNVYQSPNEKTVYHNNGENHYHAGIYVIEGRLDTYPSTTPDYIAEGVENAPLESGNYYDITHTKNKFVTAITKDQGSSVIMFNPVPENVQLNVEIVKGSNSIVVDASSIQKTIVCITGAVTVNDKLMESLKFAVVEQGTQATLVLPANTVCAIVTET